MENGKSLNGKGGKLPRGSGYLGSVTDMKKSLENIFNKSQYIPSEPLQG